MAQVTLKTGEVVLIDDVDYPLVSQYRWYRRNDGRTTYAIAHSQNEGKRKTVSMHRLLMGESALAVDHVNHDGLDNRRSNLRWATPKQNCRNSRPHQGRRFKGVGYMHGRNLSKPWKAQIRINGNQEFLGYFETEEEAARAHDNAAKRLCGEFAYLNFPEGETTDGCSTHPNL